MLIISCECFVLIRRPDGTPLDETTNQWDACSSQTPRKALVPPISACSDHADLHCAGLSSFVKEYVTARTTPIPELLCAFDIYLVGRRKLVVYSHLMLLVSVKNCNRRSRRPWYISFKSSFRESESKLSFMLTGFDVLNQIAVARAVASVHYARGCRQPNHFVASHAYFDWRRY